MSKRVIIAAGVVLLLLLILLSILRSKSGRALPIRVSMVSITNQPSGQTLAVFAIKNDGREPIRRWDRYSVEITNRPGPSPLIYFGTNHLIAPGKSEILMLPLPDTQEPWRIDLRCTPFGRRQVFSDWFCRSGYADPTAPYWRYLPKRIYVSLLGVPAQVVKSEWVIDVARQPN